MLTIPVTLAWWAVALTLSVGEFGAKGDGTTDDTRATQAALDAVPATGATVYFPPGQYRLSAISPKRNTKIELDAGATLLATPAKPNTLFYLHNDVVATTALVRALAGERRVAVASAARVSPGDRVIVSGGTFAHSGVEEGPLEFNTVASIEGEADLTLVEPLRYSYSAFGLPGASPRFTTLGPADATVRNLRITGGALRPHDGFNSIYFLFINVEAVEIDHMRFDGYGNGLTTGHNVAKLDFHDNVLRGRAAFEGGAINFASLVESRISRNVFSLENEDDDAFQANHLALEVTCRDNIISDNRLGPIRSRRSAAVELTFYPFGNQISGNRIWGVAEDVAAGKPTMGIRTYAQGSLPGLPGNAITANRISDVLVAIGDRQATSRVNDNIIFNEGTHPNATGLSLLPGPGGASVEHSGNSFRNVTVEVRQ